ncbi:MAG: hypothetical protein J07AB43_12340 [Candidatus Nanosalina sp. J07AB43]|jgi:hypothetical protein|nr:MAG: hypothetical protein J07AB43_12340 [Candidatus Nanosalina sp. J07AB43]
MSSENYRLLRMVPYIPESRSFLLRQTGTDKTGCRHEFPEKEITDHVDDIKPLASQTLESMTGISSKPVKTGESFEHYKNEGSKDVVPVLLISDEDETESIPDGFNLIDRGQIKDDSFPRLGIKTMKRLGIEM